MKQLKAIHDLFLFKDDLFRNKAEIFRNKLCTGIGQNRIYVTSYPPIGSQSRKWKYYTAAIGPAVNVLLPKENRYVDS